MKEFQNKFHLLCCRHNWQTAFSDFTEITSSAIHQYPYHLQIIEKDEDFARVEDIYLSLVKKYNKEELDIICQLYAIIVEELNTKPQDFLGEAYQQLGIHNKHNGEFFTPNHVSRLMAEIGLNNIEQYVKMNGFVSICEPACGAGVMLIEAVNMINQKGYNPREVIYCEATDINRTCFNMCYIQLGQLGIAGHVRHGNTLTNEIWESRPTPQERLFFISRKMQREVIPKKTQEKKGQFLFDF